MPRKKLTNEEKFIKEIQTAIKRGLKKYGLTNAILLLPDKEGKYRLNIKQPMTAEEIKKLPVA